MPTKSILSRALGSSDPRKKDPAIKYRTGPKGLELIKSFEGCELKAYRDIVGVWTIGYGHTEGVIPGQTITQSQAEELLKSDLTKYENYVKQNVVVPITQTQFDALVSFVYNVGSGNFKKSSVLRLTNTGQFKEAASKFLLWNKAGGKTVPGLTRRRVAEAQLYLSDIIS